MVGWRKLHNKELRNLYSSPSIIRKIKSRRMKCAGHVARMRVKRKRMRFWWESHNKKDHYEDLDIGGRIILRWMLER
jgi:hypothetical protein